MPEHAESFCVMDCLSDDPETLYDFIYAVWVIHMLVPDEDRNGFIGSHTIICIRTALP